MLCRGDMIRLRDLPAHLVSAGDNAILAKGANLKEVKKSAILQAFQSNNCRGVKTARELGIDKNSLWRNIIRFGIKAPLTEKRNL